MHKIPDKYWDIYFDEFIIPYIKNNGKRLFPEIYENLCYEHYNLLHKTNFTQDDLKLNTTECWVCKQKDR